MQISMFDLDCHKPYKIKKPIRLIELFGGIGSQAKALENLQTNFTHYRLCEVDKYAVASYNAIHKTSFLPSDITKLSAKDLGITETDKYDYILTYSFPCQDLSKAGKMQGMAKGSNTRSGLLWEVERLLKECKELPQVLLMENVPQVLNCDFGGWLDFLQALGYKNYYKKLNAKNFGIPQNRERCFMVSVLGNYYYDFPKKIPLKINLADIVECNPKYKVDMSKLTATQRKCLEKVATLIQKDTTSKAVRTSGFSSYDKHTWNIYGIRIGQSPDYTKVMNGLAKTLCSNKADGGYAISNMGEIEYYYYSPLETWRLMGFTDSDFDKAKASEVSNSQLYKQAGNSIVVKVLEETFKKLF
jgi:DNA (cytosine-5)-methyltransferase 1